MLRLIATRLSTNSRFYLPFYIGFYLSSTFQVRFQPLRGERLQTGGRRAASTNRRDAHFRLLSKERRDGLRRSRQTSSRKAARKENAMSFQITGLDAAPFRRFYGLSDEELQSFGVKRLIADTRPGFPDRVELRDVEQGEALLLLNYLHQPADTPYKASHAIFVREWAETPYRAVDEIPDVLRIRPISLRAFDVSGDMVDADLTEGDLEPTIARLFANPEAAYIHAHYAKRGCYAARIDRA
jgi:hypothetical protein